MLRTEKDFLEFVTGLLANPSDVWQTLSQEDLDKLRSITNKLVELNEELDNVKKSIFYQKGKDKTQFYSKDLETLDLNVINILHGSVGKVTESIEALQNVIGAVQAVPREIDMPNLAEELADSGFYDGVIMEYAGFSLNELLDLIYNKLSARYSSGKFSQQDALQRNLDNERSEIERSLTND